MSNTWTHARVSRLQCLWSAGKTAGQIAIALNVSRCAVIGKLNRLGLIGGMSDRERAQRQASSITDEYRERQRQTSLRQWREWRAQRAA